MTVLSPKTAIDQGWVYVPDGEVDQELQLQQVGVDLTIAKLYVLVDEAVIGKNDRVLPQYKELVPDKVQAVKKDPKDRSKTEVITMPKAWRLDPGYYMWDAYEWCRIPSHAKARIVQRSSMLKSGALVFSSVWDPGFEGRLGCALEIKKPLKLEQGARIAQVVFWQADAHSDYQGVYLGTGVSDLSGLTTSGS